MLSKVKSNHRYLHYLIWLIIANSCTSVNQWATIPVGNTFTTWIINYTIVGLCVYHFCVSRSHYTYKLYGLCEIYLIWALIGALRGLFIAKGYWQYKNLLEGCLMTSLPLFVYVLSSPTFDRMLLRRWNRIMIPAFVLFFSWSCSPSCFFYILPFILLYGSFFKLLPYKWKIIVFVLLILFCVDVTNRSNIIKVAITLIVCLGVYCRRFIPFFVLSIVHWFLYLVTFVVIIAAASGSFNILEMMGNSNEKSVKSSSGEEENLADDTRTFIYYEVISSAIKHDYYLFGHTQARGNDSEIFITGADAKDEDLTKTGERYSNELVHLNIFTWLGIIGLVLYSLIYLQSSYLAVYHSNNIYMKFIGCTIAFHWLFGWIEDLNSFTVQNIWLWMMIAMGISPQFRRMTNMDFSRWFRSIFRSRKTKIINVKDRK